MNIYSQNKIGYEHEHSHSNPFINVPAKTGPYGLIFHLQNGKYIVLGFTIPTANIKEIT